MSEVTLSPEAIRFRALIISAVWNDRFGYVDEDTFVGECPCCGFPLGVRFAGKAARATLTCHSGWCTEAEVVAKITGVGVTA
jgi:hypothetical protein